MPPAGDGVAPNGAPAARDRDASGRPRNARPRDALGRPLPRGAAGEPIIGDDVTLPPREALALAQRLLDSGQPFHAHEVLEAAWRSATGRREGWKGLAQLAVGLTHARRGNARGAVALLRRGADTVASCPAGILPGVDGAAVALSAHDLADRIERSGLAGLTPEQLSLRLVS